MSTRGTVRAEFLLNILEVCGAFVGSVLQQGARVLIKDISASAATKNERHFFPYPMSNSLVLRNVFRLGYLSVRIIVSRQITFAHSEYLVYSIYKKHLKTLRYNGYMNS
jgi:hypothetical protein